MTAMCWGSRENMRAAGSGHVGLHVRFLIEDERIAVEINRWSSRTDSTRSNNNYKSFVGTVVASVVLGTVQGCPEEVTGGIATRAVDIEILEEIAHVELSSIIPARE